MVVKDVRFLFEKLLKILDNEKKAIEIKDMELLEKIGIEIEQLLTDIKESPPTGEVDRVTALAAAAASQKRNENRKLLEALFEQTGSELSHIRRGKQVHRAYSPEYSGSEIYIKKNC